MTPIRISNSEVQTFKRCRRRWMLAYHRGLQPRLEHRTGALAIGTRVHKALEEYYGNGRDLLQAHAELVAVDRDTLLREERDTTDFDSEAELSRLMLEGYLEWLAETGADSDLDVVAAEQVLTAPLLDGQVELTGRLDLRVKRKRDGVRLFLDHKTTGAFADVARRAQQDEQMLTYHLLEALQPDETERCDGALYSLLRKVKRTASARPPFYERLEVRHNKSELRSFWTRLHGVIAEILRTRRALDSGASHHEVAYPTPTGTCSWECQFYQVCNLFDDGGAIDQALDELYQVGDPYQRYANDEVKEDARA